MAKYVLGEEGARKFKQLTKQTTGIKNRMNLSPQHVIDNLYPHPYEIRWSESQISGGGYMMWLPNNCLQVNGYNIPPSSWLASGGISLTECKVSELSTDYWYDVSKFLGIGDLSSYSVFLNSYYGEVLMSLSATDRWPGVPGFVHIANVENYRPKANVRSNLILDSKESPFDLRQLSSEYPTLKNWEMNYQVFEADGKIYSLPNCTVSADLGDLNPRFLRLVELSAGSWCIDSKTAENANDIEAMGSLEIGKVLTPNITSEISTAKSVHPLWFMTAANGIGYDIREAWYIINDALSCDDVSITKDSNVDSDLSSEWKDKARLYGFHSQGDATGWDNATSFVVRQNGGGIANPPQGGEYLGYLNVSDFRNGVMQQVADTMLSGHGGGVMSALEFDEQSVSKGGDGWSATDLSGNTVPTIHMWHFHDNGADVDSPEMCDIILRYNPISASSDKWLRYISYDDFKAKLSSDIGGGGGSSGGEISADQLSAIPSPGMFSWTPATRTMGAGGCMFGRQWVTATGTGAGKADGLYQLRCSIANTGYTTCAVVSDATLGQAPTTQYCWIPIYQISDGKILNDYRGAFVVPCYE